MVEMENPDFLGYSLVNGYPKFRYTNGKHVITELIQMNDEKLGFAELSLYLHRQKLYLIFLPVASFNNYRQGY